MLLPKKLILPALLALFSCQIFAMNLDKNTLKEEAMKKLSSYSAYIPEPVKKAGTFLAKHKLATAAVALGAVALAHATGYNPVRSLFKEKIQQPRYENFWDWKKACDAQCTSMHNSPLKIEEFIGEIDQFCASQQAALADQNKWLHPESEDRYRIERLEVAPETEIAFHGDVHGDIKSLNAFIEFLANKNYLDKNNPFKIANPNFKMIMLGDYTDRGSFGSEVLYTIMRMKRLNPDQFFMVRGNHEDREINKGYGYSTELRLKFGSEYYLDNVSQIYYKLPVALYLVSGKEQKNALLCCHGGLEIGSPNVKQLLDDNRAHCYSALDFLERGTCIEQLPSDYHPCFNKLSQNSLEDQEPHYPSSIGHLWNDFNFKSSQEKGQEITRTGDRWEFPEQLTKYLLQKDSTPTCKLRGVFRAHQHNEETMPRILNQDGMSDPRDVGVAKLWLPENTQQPAGQLWDGIVCTFCVSPNNGFGYSYKYNFDTFGILKTAEKFEDWRLAMHRLETRQ